MKRMLSSHFENNILEITFDNFVSFYNLNNGKSVNIPNEYIHYKDFVLLNNKFYETKKDSTYFPKVVIGLNITTNCNLRCKYCFNDKTKKEIINIELAKKFIDYIVDVKKDAEKFFVDMAGSGEPLLYIKEILEIADYCMIVSDRIGKEVTPMLATNGLLLDEIYVNSLQKHNVLFGVSVDGYEEMHDKYRIDINGKPTFKTIKERVSRIEFNDYVGGAMTFSDPETDIFKSYEEMIKMFKTVSIRPCRMSYSNFNFSYILSGYEKFVDYLVKETLNNNLNPLRSIINGDDFFGKTILKIVSNSKLNRRCEAGFARFALSPNGRIFPCSPAIFHSDLEIKKEDIEIGLNNIFFRDIQKKCESCVAKNVCGSDCFVLLYENVNETNLCEFKKEIFHFALYFCGIIELVDFDIYSKIVELANEIIVRSYCDKDLQELYSKCRSKYSFTQLKYLKDHNQNEYSELKEKHLKRDITL